MPLYHGPLMRNGYYFSKRRYQARGRPIYYGRRYGNRVRYQARVLAYRNSRSYSHGRRFPVPLRSEMKYISLGDSATQITTTTQYNLLNGCNIGAGITQRIGRRITIKKIHFRYWISHELLSSTLEAYGRIIIVYDKQSNGVAPVLTDIYDMYTGNPATMYRQIDHLSRFTVLYNKNFLLAGENHGSPTTAIENWNKNVSIPVEYNAGNNGDITDISTGALYMIAIGNTAAGADNVLFNWTCRCAFTDK